MPGKALRKICGWPVLSHILDRFRASHRTEKIVVCTSTRKEDDTIDNLCRMEEVHCHRSDQSRKGNVLALMDEAIQAHLPEADLVFRGMGDCMFTEPELIDQRADILRRRGSDVVWPGLADDPWPIYWARESPWSRAAWDLAVEQSSGSQMEHAGAWIYDNLREVRVTHTEMLREEYYRPYRLELDTLADMEVITQIFNALWQGTGHAIPMIDVIRWLDAHPDVAEINVDVPLKSITRPRWRLFRGQSVWRCEKCGATRPVAKAIQGKALVTVCQRCGAERSFIEIPSFLAGRRKR